MEASITQYQMPTQMTLSLSVEAFPAMGIHVCISNAKTGKQVSEMLIQFDKAEYIANAILLMIAREEKSNA